LGVNSNGGDIDRLQPTRLTRAVKVIPVLLLVLASCGASLPTATAGTRYDRETRRLSLDYTDTERGVVLADVAHACDLDLSIVGPATQRVSLVMDNVEVGAAFGQLKQSTGFLLNSDGKLLRALPKSGAIQPWDYEGDLFVRPAEPATEPRSPIAATNKPVREILREIADQRELNLVLPENFAGTATLHLRAATWREAFRELLFPLGYTFTADEGILRVHQVNFCTAQPVAPAPALSTNRLLRALLLSQGPALLLFGLGFVVHAVLALGTVRTPLPRPTLFAPKWLWVLLILAGGVLPLLCYWIFHYSPFSAHPKESVS